MTTSVKTHPYNPQQEILADATPVQPSESYAFYASTDNHDVPPTQTPNSSTTMEAPPTVTTVVVPGPSVPPTYCTARQKYVFVDSRKPVTLTCCPSCTKKQIATRTRTKANGTTALCVVAGFIIFWPLCWIPLCIRSMKQTNHYCSSCGAKVGRVKPFQ